MDDKGLLYHVVPTKNGETAHLVVPKDLWSQLIKWYHDHPTSGHSGLTKSSEKIRQKYYWHGMYKDVEQSIKTCIACAQKKRPVNASMPPLFPFL